MKKKALYILALAALTFAGCKGDYDDWAAPQGFEQEEARSVSLTATAASPIDMAEVTTDSLVLFTPSVTMGEEDKVVGYELVLDGTQNIPVTLEAKASVEDLKNAVVALYGQAPVERTLAGVVTGLIQADGSVMTVSADISLSVTLHVDYGEFVYVVGNPAWSPETAASLRSPNFDGVYTGFSYVDGDFKFTKHRNWDDGEYNFADFTTLGEGIVQGEGSNINIATAGYYYLVADLSTGSLTATLIEKMGIIGSATPSGWDADTEMAYDATNDCWTVTVDLVAGVFKFRVNGDWAINLCGTTDNLSQDGADIAVDEAGTYTITLYASRTTSNNIYCTVEKQ